MSLRVKLTGDIHRRAMFKRAFLTPHAGSRTSNPGRNSRNRMTCSSGWWTCSGRWTCIGRWTCRSGRRRCISRWSRRRRLGRTGLIGLLRIFRLNMNYGLRERNGEGQPHEHYRCDLVAMVWQFLLRARELNTSDSDSYPR